MEQDSGAEGPSIDELRERYRQEQQKRLRPEGMAQCRELGEELDRDPFVEPGFTRDPVVEETTVVIVGGGFAGMLTAIDLGKHGITDVRIVEKAGDFGGTWYWNRYPGCMCDVESYVYLPLLEETGFMPTEHYASATEIFEYSKLLARTFDLYPHALFQTDVTGAEWDEEALRWQVTTSRGDRLSARFLVLAGGILHKAKLPGIPGIEDFEGKAFHTSRWDYGYTGGGPTEPMDKLADKRVGIIGTGATAVQVVPQVARVAKELYVFQRTPGAVGVRNQQPTDVEWFQSLEPGWQHERIVNFTQAVTGAQPEVDLVHDGWTEVHVGRHPEGLGARGGGRGARADRLRGDGDDPATDRRDRRGPRDGREAQAVLGQALQAGLLPRRLPAGLQPAQRAPGRHRRSGRRRDHRRAGPWSTASSTRSTCSIYASGLRGHHGPAPPARLRPQGGRDGVALSERWAEGAHTLHGVLASGFPNLLLISLVQGGFGTNFSHLLSESAKHVAHILEACVEQGIVEHRAGGGRRGGVALRAPRRRCRRRPLLPGLHAQLLQQRAAGDRRPGGPEPHLLRQPPRLHRLPRALARGPRLRRRHGAARGDHRSTRRSREACRRRAVGPDCPDRRPAPDWPGGPVDGRPDPAPVWFAGLR